MASGTVQARREVDQEADVLFQPDFLAENRREAANAIAVLARCVVVQLRRDRLLLQQQDAVTHQFAFAQLNAQLAALVGHRDVNRTWAKGGLLNLLEVLTLVH
jgi:hypothetical protein